MSRRVAWDDQHAFLSVLEEGSLSGAARRLGVAQATVRARVEALEGALGTVLFTRSANGLVPTEQARSVADAARAMSRASNAFVRAASAQSGEIAGTVRLSVSEFVGIEVLPTMLANLRLSYPHLIVEIVLSNASADLIEQEVDIAVRMHPPRQEALIAKKVGTIPLGLFASRDYLARRGVPTSLESLSEHDFVGPDRARADLNLAGEVFPGLARDRFVVRTDSHPAQLALARAGVGIAVAHTPVGRADPMLRQILADLQIASLDTWIVVHEDLRNVARVSALFDHLVRSFTHFASLECERTGTFAPV